MTESSEETHSTLTATAAKPPLWQVVSLVGGGLLVFILLLFADRTLLTGEEQKVQPGAQPAPAAATTTGNSTLPPLPDGPDGQVLRGLAAQHVQSPADTAISKKAIAAAVNANRPDYQAAWLDTLYQQTGRTEHLLAAADAYLAALNRPPASENETLRSQLARRGYDLLAPYVAATPTDLQTRMNQSLLYVESGDPSIIMQGISGLRTLADENPSYVPAQIRMGLFSFQTGQYSKAEARFRTALTHEPSQPQALLFMGLSLLEQGKTTEAKPFLTKAARASDPAISGAATEALQRLR